MDGPWDSFLTSDPAMVVAKDVDSGPNTSLRGGAIQAQDGSNEHYYSLEDQESQASVVSEILVEEISIKNAESSEAADSNIDGICKDLGGYNSEPDLQDTCYDECNSRRNDSSTKECIPVNELVKTSGLSFLNLSRELNVMSLPGCRSSLSTVDKDLDVELKLELDAIEAQYQHWLQELSRKREEALEANKKGWMAKKKLAVQRLRT